VIIKFSRNIRFIELDIVEEKLIKQTLYRKNDFVEVSKNLAGYKSENNFRPSKYYVGCLNIFDNAKCFNILATNLNILFIF